MDLVIDNVTIFTNDRANQVLTGQAVAITGRSIAAVGPAAEIRAAHPDHQRLDGAGRLLMPGLINVHMHYYGTFARGIALTETPRNFHEILQYLWWKLDRTLDLDAVYYSALLPAITAVKKGVTAIIDHHASPNAVDGSLDRIEEAMDLVGLRGILCYEVSDRDGKQVRDAGLAENGRYIRRCAKARADDPLHRFAGLVGLHASFTLDDDSLAKATGLMGDTGRGAHIHMLEDRVDETETQRKYGSSVVQRLNENGILGPGTITAHGIFVNDYDIALLAESNTIVAHQAQSNMNNAVGRAEVFHLLRHGIMVGLGTDGMTPDMLAETRTGYLMHKHHLADNNAGWGEYEQMLLKHNPAIYRRLSGRDVGQVSPGFAADLILVDYYPPTPLTGENIWGHFLYGLVDAPVDTTIIDGRIVMQNKVISGIDEGAIAAAARKSAQAVWARFAG